MPISPDEPIYALRRQLAAEIVRSLGPDAQHVISRSYGIPQPRMSELNRGVVDRGSTEWLIRRIYSLGGQVTVTATLGDARREWSRQRFAAARVARALRKPSRVQNIVQKSRWSTRQPIAYARDLRLGRPRNMIP